MELLDHVAPPLRLVDGLRRLDDVSSLDGYGPALVASVRALLADGADVLAVTAGVAQVNDALTRQLLRLAEAELGPPPAAYAWLALGSQGRGEQVLSSDQDSALAYDDGLAGSPVTDAYFAQLARLVVRGLARAGVPECAGGYLATQWCRPLREYRSLFRAWVARPEPQALLRAEVFLDVRRVHGDLSVDVLDSILVAGGSHGPFKAQLARAAITFRPPLRWFGRFRDPHGLLDVKAGGTAAIVLLARLYALAGGSSARATVPRLEDAAAAGTLSRPGAASLVEAYRFLTDLRLRRQLEQVGTGRAADNLVALDDLSPAQRDALRRTLRHVRDVQEATATRFATHTVT